MDIRALHSSDTHITVSLPYHIWLVNVGYLYIISSYINIQQDIPHEKSPNLMALYPHLPLNPLVNPHFPKIVALEMSKMP